MKKYTTIFLCLMTTFAIGQSFKVGVRSGTNFSTFNGPLETAVNETHGFSNGFHFGLNYTYYPVPDFGIRAELLYTQSGTKIELDGPSYYLLRYNNEKYVELGNREMTLDISNAYLSIPITLQYQATKKFEFFGGIYTSFIVSPSAGGRMFFVSNDNPNDFFFNQSQQYDYNSDNRRDDTEINQLPKSSSNVLVNDIIDGSDNPIAIPKVVGAYYGYDEPITESYIKKLDLGGILGVNYFLNSGFYVGVRGEYGLRDITNDFLDISYERVESNGDYIKRTDRDTHLGIQISFGFRF